MKVNFNIRNHGPFHIQDFVDYVAAGVEDLGLQFMLSRNMRRGAINIMLENFEDPEVVADVEYACHKAPDMPFVIAASEVMQDGVFNSGGWKPGIPDDSPYSQMAAWTRRTRSFVRVAPLAHAILCPSELLYDSYADYGIGDRLHYLPFVHLGGFASERVDRPEVDEDVDFMFTGVLTERRRRLLGDLERRGYAVTYLPVNAPEYMRHHFMRRAKVYLAPKHFDETRTLSKMRVYWALCHGYYCMVETGTDRTDLDDYLNWYSTIEDLVAAVSLDTAQRHAMAADQLARFRAERSDNPFAEIFAPWLDGSGAAA
ncbi:MAG TPA: hypothetical protein VK891_02750 [Euzebyales bacterium]|nr:hypothetical protein [Euzebyales bacterium]